MNQQKRPLAVVTGASTGIGYAAIGDRASRGIVGRDGLRSSLEADLLE